MVGIDSTQKVRRAAVTAKNHIPTIKELISEVMQMTSEDAIKWIQLDIDMMKFDPNTGEEAYLNEDAKKLIEAQELAIKALKEFKERGL